VVTEDPIDLFGRILGDALALDRKLVPEPTAMSVASVGADGQPSVRIMLLKSHDRNGFVFYTNFGGRKGRELLANPRTALCFHWPHLEVQVRVEGEAEKVSDADADEYFSSRPRQSQLAAWASIQSARVERDGDLELRFAEYERQYEGRQVPRPPHWSGFRVTARTIEFWYNRPGRLHLRHLYSRSGNRWNVETLYP